MKRSFDILDIDKARYLVQAINIFLFLKEVVLMGIVFRPEFNSRRILDVSKCIIVPVIHFYWGNSI